MVSSIPRSGISLHGVAGTADGLKPGSGSAVLCKLNEGILQDLRKASQAKDALRFVTGSAPVSQAPSSQHQAGTEPLTETPHWQPNDRPKHIF